MTRVVVTCGLGGVGKTTIAAALGISFALAGEKVIILTIDPARRLADALGVPLEGNEPTPVVLNGVTIANGGSLSALMLDSKVVWDQMIRRFSDDEAAAIKILNNRYYQAVSTKLTGTHEYMAVESLYDLVMSQNYDTVVLDTPPASHAVDFFNTPNRIRGLFERRLVASLFSPDLAGRGILRVARDGTIRLLQGVIGTEVVGDISEFFHLLSEMSAGFVERHKKINNLLRSEQAFYYLVTSTSTNRSSDALTFREYLDNEGMKLAGVIVNRVSPLHDQHTLVSNHSNLSEMSEAEAALFNEWGNWLEQESRASLERSQRDIETLATISKAVTNTPVIPIEDDPSGVFDVESLLKTARQLPDIPYPPD